MPLVDVAIAKWRRWREKVARGEESRRNVFQQLHDAARHQDCEIIAYLLWEADGKPEGNGEHYYQEAQRRLKGFRWRLYQLHQPFISLEKKVIEPLDSWADRANIFQFFSKISPILEALGVLAIPFVILAFEFRQERRQQQFEERVISSQADVRQQQAVREYLSQVTTIHLESDQGEKLRENEELQKLLEANTLALFNELSVREDTRQDAEQDEEFDLEKANEIWNRDRKGQVVEFLSGLNWINSSENKQPLVSLSKANLEEANLSIANLEGADLEGANLEGADLSIANLGGADLEVGDLDRAYLYGANLREANLRGANLERAYLYGANLRGAYLRETYLREAYLEEAYLKEANLRGAYLGEADLRRADLRRADLRRADLRGAYLGGAYLGEANLERANLREANLEGANLERANLEGANLANIPNLSNNQIKSACNWEKAIYTNVELEFNDGKLRWVAKDEQANQRIIAEIRQDKASDPQQTPKCDRIL